MILLSIILETNVLYGNDDRLNFDLKLPYQINVPPKFVPLSSNLLCFISTVLLVAIIAPPMNPSPKQPSSGSYKTHFLCDSLLFDTNVLLTSVLLYQ